MTFVALRALYIVILLGLSGPAFVVVVRGKEAGRRKARGEISEKLRRCLSIPLRDTKSRNAAFSRVAVEVPASE